MSARNLVVALFVVGGTLAASEDAQAFCRTKACDTDPSYGDAWDGTPEPTECVRNAQGCLLDGTPLFWKSGCMSFGVQQDGSVSSNVDYETALATIQDGFDKWAAADCGGGETPSFRIVDKGEIACDRIEYNQDGANANVFLFRDADWPYRNLGGDALALTTVTYSVETAEIYDADVELNSHETLFTTSDEPSEIVSDLSSVVTHEIGHFLGLSHSEENTAVMRGIGYTSGSTDLRVLTDDDVTGICEVFPPGPPAGGSCTPRHGFSRECGTGTKTTDGGCSVAPGRRSSKPFGLLAFGALAFGALLVISRRRQQRR